MAGGNNEQQTNTKDFNVLEFLEGLAARGDRNSPEGFVNDFELNQTCMILIVVFVLLFMYKKEVMAMVNKYLK